MRSSRRACALACVALLGMAIPAPAQVTTGSVFGTVHDAQGGVIPGATVVLISESRGTRSEPAITSPTGDFVFPNVSVDTYTVEVTMASFSTLKRTGVARQRRIAGRGRGPHDRASAARARPCTVKGESPVIQAASGERSFTIPTESVQNLPLANRSFTALAQLAPGVTGTSALGTRANMSTQLHDGRHLDDGHRQQHRDAADEHRVDCRGQAARVRLPGRVRPVERPAGHGGHQERDQPVPRIRSTTSSATRTGTPTARQNILNGLPKTVSKQQRLGLLDRRADRQARRQQQAVLLPRGRVPAAHRRQRPAAFRVPTALERARRFLADGRHQRRSLPLHQGSAVERAPAPRRPRPAASRTGGVLGRIPQDRLYQPGLAILKMWPLPTSSYDGRDRTCSSSGRPRRRSAYQPAMRFDYQALPSLRISYKYQGQITRAAGEPGQRFPDWNDTVTPYTGVGTDAVSVNYNLDSTTFLEGTFGPRVEQAGQLSGQCHLRSPDGRSGEPSAPLPERQRHQPRLLQLRAP